MLTVSQENRHFKYSTFLDVKESNPIVYCLQIWLYIVCKNPFDLARLSKEHNFVGTGLDALSQRLIKVLFRVQVNYNTDTNFYVSSKFTQKLLFLFSA